jgi:hypothetical protein
VFDFDTGAFAGVEWLIRADLYREQPCPQEGAVGAGAAVVRPQKKTTVRSAAIGEVAATDSA